MLELQIILQFEHRIYLRDTDLLLVIPYLFIYLFACIYLLAHFKASTSSDGSRPIGLLPEEHSIMFKSAILCSNCNNYYSLDTRQIYNILYFKYL